MKNTLKTKENTFNFWPSFSDVFMSILFILILFLFLLVIKVYLLELIDVKAVSQELLTNIKNSLGQDSTIIAGDALSANNHTILFKDSFLFDQGKSEFKDAKSKEFIKIIANEIRKFVEAGRISEIVVEGHTNSDKFRNDPYGNWSLSSSRAVTVVRVLDEAGIIKSFLKDSTNSTRILSVSGYSQYDFIHEDSQVNENKEASKRIQISIKYKIDSKD
jgi:flagellar motor protein MotB